MWQLRCALARYVKIRLHRKQDIVSTCVFENYRKHVQYSQIHSFVEDIDRKRIKQMLHSHDKCYLERIEQRTLEIKHNKDILTKREFELATLFTNGDRTAAVAAKLGISPNTVKNHLKNIFKKLEVKNKKELAYKLLNLTQVQ